MAGNKKSRAVPYVLALFAVLAFSASSCATVRFLMTDPEGVEEASECMERGDWECAVRYYDRVIEQDPTEPNWFNNRAAAKYMLGQFRPAAEDCQKALYIDPNHVPARVNKGYSLIELSRYEDAVATLSWAIDINQISADARNARGIAYYELGDYRRAIKDFNVAIEFRDDFGPAYLYRGLSRKALGEDIEADSDIEKAKELEGQGTVRLYLEGDALQEAQHSGRADSFPMIPPGGTLQDLYYGEPDINPYNYEYAYIVVPPVFPGE